MLKKDRKVQIQKSLKSQVKILNKCINHIVFLISVLYIIDSSSWLEKYLENFRSNLELNKEIDSLIEEFTIQKGEANLGDALEDYVGIKLDFLKKQRLNDFAEKLDSLKKTIDYPERVTELDKENLKQSLVEASRIMTENIQEDNGFSYCSISFDSENDYGWIYKEADFTCEAGSYRIYDDMLNAYAYNYELLRNHIDLKYSDIPDYNPIVNGIIKSTLCNIVLEDNKVQVIIPEKVKKMVKEKNK